MKIFDIVNGHIAPTANSLNVPEFKVIWDRDKSEDKSKAIKELSYVAFLIDESLQNPYRGYNYIDRVPILKRDFLGSDKAKVDKVITAAIKKYKELSFSTNMRLLKAARAATDKLSEYYEDMASSDITKFKPRDLSSNLKDVGGIIKSLDMLEEFVKKEQAESKVRGGGEIGLYEVPRNDFDYGE